MIRDNIYVHHFKSVAKCLKENEDKTAVYYLPNYSPELNPDELLNAGQLRNKMALTRAVIDALRSTQKQPERVENYFG